MAVLAVNCNSFTTFAAQTTFVSLNKKKEIMKTLGYFGAFLGGAIAGAAITDAVEDFCNKHNIKLSRKEVDDLVDDIKEAAADIVE